MSFADELDAAVPNRNRYTAGPGLMDRIFAALDDTDRAALEAALRNPVRYPAPHLAQFLTDRGHRVSRATILDWRRRRGIR